MQFYKIEVNWQKNVKRNSIGRKAVRGPHRPPTAIPANVSEDETRGDTWPTFS